MGYHTNIVKIQDSFSLEHKYIFKKYRYHPPLQPICTIFISNATLYYFICHFPWHFSCLQGSFNSSCAVMLEKVWRTWSIEEDPPWTIGVAPLWNAKDVTPHNVKHDVIFIAYGNGRAPVILWMGFLSFWMGMCSWNFSNQDLTWTMPINKYWECFHSKQMHLSIRIVPYFFWQAINICKYFLLMIRILYN